MLRACRRAASRERRTPSPQPRPGRYARIQVVVHCAFTAMVPITLHLAGRRVHLVVRQDDCRSCVNHEAHQPVDRLAFIASELASAVHSNAAVLADLRHVVAESVSLYNPHRVSEVDIVRHVVSLLETGRLLAIDCRLPVERGVLAPQGAAPTKPRPIQPPRRIRDDPPTKTWVEIELVDAAGKPVPNQKYRIKLPDGEWHEGVLDQKGRARFADIDPGTCDISFPEIDGREWKEA